MRIHSVADRTRTDLSRFVTDLGWVPADADAYEQNFETLILEFDRKCADAGNEFVADQSAAGAPSPLWAATRRQGTSES